MITLLHGDNIEASRNELTRVKQQAAGGEIRQLDGQSIDESMLVQSLESSSLFGSETLVIVERLFMKLGRQPKKIEALCTILAKATGDIVLWEEKEVGATVIKNLGTPAVRLFKLPVLIFQFLDTLRLETFEKLMETESAELVFAMLVKRVRFLIQLRDNTTPQGLSGWQLTRLTTQAKSFTMSELTLMYDALGEVEYRIKSGGSAFSMRQELEQWILQFLKTTTFGASTRRS